MKLLIIGNGFDIAHGLPTRYTDFLRHCRDFDKNEPISTDSGMNEEFSLFVKDNVWLKYFIHLTGNLDNPRTWIDFEKEIAEVIHDFDIANPRILSTRYFGEMFEDIEEITLTFLHIPTKVEQFISSFTSYDRGTGKTIVRNSYLKEFVDFEFVNFLYAQLRAFARAFEIYCLRINETSTDVVITTERKRQIEKAKSDADNYAHQAQQASGDIHRKDDAIRFEEMWNQADEQWKSLISGIGFIDYLSMSKFDHVLSFNYTNTYERLYGIGNENTKYCYIHGRAQNEAAKTNIIFGIDDESSHGEESKNFKWIKFKKYFQRIIFKTGSEYKDWLRLNTPAKQYVYQDYVFIVGHSLDKTDHDVLYEIFSDTRFKIIIYYYNSGDFEDKVQKVIQLLAYKGGNGRDEIIRRVHGAQWSIKFVDQHDETYGLFNSRGR